MTNKNIVIEGALIRFPNFSGKEGQYNPEGNRNFCILLDDDLAEKLKEDGWNVKYLTPKNPDDGRQAYMQITVKYEHIPPKIYLVRSDSKVLLDENTVGVLDWAEMKNVDIVIRPHNWTVGGRSGIKAYVKTLYVTIAEDEFASKYRDCPDSASNIMMSDFE